jgi:hypothetical protein
MSLDFVAYGVVQAGCVVIMGRPETDPSELTAALLEVVVEQTGASLPDAARALQRATASLQGRVCS